MTINIANPVIQSWWFFGFLAIVTLATTRYRPKFNPLDPKLTNQLKGWAIQAVVFSHIGYFLINQHQFLQPISFFAGVGVNLFLFLSGYGLAISGLKKPLSPLQFYHKRLTKLYLPMWISLIIFLFLDFWLLKLSYPSKTLIDSFLGYFPTANLFTNINSPLWFFSLILIYYVTFPWLFWKRLPWIYPFIIIFGARWLLQQTPPDDFKNLDLYLKHYLAFPLGVSTAILIMNSYIQKFFIFSLHLWNKTTRYIQLILRFIVILIISIIFHYQAIYSNVGTTPALEQQTSLIQMALLLILFWLIPLQIKLWEWLGKYSYEIFLLHWPILARYEFLYRFIPASIATFIYLWLFLGISYVLDWIINQITGSKKLFLRIFRQ